MTQIFHRRSNALIRGFLIFCTISLILATWLGNVFVRSAYMTRADVVRDQPVPFSHAHHVAGLGIDCRYCHTSVEKSSIAGMPSTETCMGCHSQIWRDSPLLEPVRDSYRTGKPLAWTRVHDLPDFVYFNHSIHVAKGVACQSCHGDVDRMPLMRQVTPLHMDWCLDCHRHPEQAVREKGDVFKFIRPSSTVPIAASKPGTFESPHEPGAPAHALIAELAQHSDGKQLVHKYGINVPQLENCAICHR